MEYDAPFEPDPHAAESIPEPDEWTRNDDPNDREGMSPLGVGLLIVLILGLVIGAAWWLSRDHAEPLEPASRPAPSGAVGGQDGGVASPQTAPEREAVPLPPLAASDAFVRQAAARLSEHPALVRWLAREDLVRRAVATVANVAHGESPRSHLDFLAPQEPYLARRTGDRLVADPKSYGRYDLMVDVFTSLDIGTTVQLFHTLEPLFDEAYREIAPPGASFRDAFAQAIDQLLAVRVPPESPELQEGVLSYRYADPQLEELSPAQKHLLRLGPERAARLQTKLRFLQAGLDLGSPAGGA